MKYIVLLRGINISCKNKIVMSELKRVLEINNYKNVFTYLNSGNVILESNDSKEYITNNICNIIKNSFKLDIPVFVMSEDELEDILNNKPDWWGTNNKEIYDNLILIMPPCSSDEVCSVVGLPSDGIDKINIYKNSIFWSFELKNYRKSNWWVKTASSSIKDNITIRTANTMKKLLELCNK